MFAAHTPRYGTPDVLEIHEVPTPTPGPTDVLVTVEATPVTAGDRRLRAADFPGFLGPVGRLMFGLFRPRVPVQGTMFAGTIAAVGAEVTRFAVGERVVGSIDQGAYAEQIVVPEDGRIVHAPTNMTSVEAASLPYGAGTALHFVRDVAKLQRGERILIVGASGGVGRAAVQLAHHLGAEVTAVCGTANVDHVRDLGATRVLDHTEGDVMARAGAHDVVLDIAGVTSFASARPALTRHGRYVALHVTLATVITMIAPAPWGGPTAHTGVSMPDTATIAELVRLADAGVFAPRVAATYPLHRIAEAHAASGTVFGDVVVTPCAPVATVDEVVDAA